jgi:hypothetical protein
MDIFARDIAKFETRVRKAFTRELSQAQFDAAVSFDFNTGGIHRASWVDHFNAGRDAQAKKAFMNWSKPREIIPPPQGRARSVLYRQVWRWRCQHLSGHAIGQGDVAQRQACRCV